LSVVSAALAGVPPDPQILHGHDAFWGEPTVTLTPADGLSRFALSSAARLLIVALPEPPVRHE
jgi:hypothetical protein